MYTIPLRRALVTDSDLPYPEGVACAEVLKVGSGERGDGEAVESRRGAEGRAVVGSIVSARFRDRRADAHLRQRRGAVFSPRRPRRRTGFDFSLSFALFAVGHLVGLSVGIAMLVGALIGWGWGGAALHPRARLAGSGRLDVAQGAWDHQVRFVGAGTIGVAAVWTLGKLVKPVFGGLRQRMAASHALAAGQAHTLPRMERDIPDWHRRPGVAVLPAAGGGCFWDFSTISGLGVTCALLTIAGVIFVAIMGFLVSAVCGYMAGLIGSSNSPLSGIGILVVVRSRCCWWSVCIEPAARVPAKRWSHSHCS